MSIFGKLVKDISFDDIKDLEKEGSQENIILEFKGDLVGPDATIKTIKTIKELSAFANTYGGYLVVGIADDGNGRVKSLDGVAPKPNYSQTLVNWCLEHIYPPITPSVSPPIDHPTDTDKVFYVIHVEQSSEAPHFLTSRRGCYIRVGEHSKPFEPKLATYEDIQHLANRRRQAEDKREMILRRADKRFDEHMKRFCAEAKLAGDVGARLTLAIVPSYPGRQLATIDRLDELVRKEAHIQINGGQFPQGNAQSQHDGFFYRASDVYVEVDVNGLIFYGCTITKRMLPESPQDESQRKPIDCLTMMLSIVLFLSHARYFYPNFGYDGWIRVYAGMAAIKDRRIINPCRIMGRIAADFDANHRCLLDEDFEFSLEKNARQLQGELDQIAQEIYEHICFACGWPDVRRNINLTEELIKCAFKTLHIDCEQAQK
ncbi:MAG: ATP-binding protein [Planctomycetota bacterium]